jgi:hypothetical protein
LVFISPDFERRYYNVYLYLLGVLTWFLHTRFFGSTNLAIGSESSRYEKTLSPIMILGTTSSTIHGFSTTDSSSVDVVSYLTIDFGQMLCQKVTPYFVCFSSETDFCAWGEGPIPEAQSVQTYVEPSIPSGLKTFCSRLKFYRVVK